MPNVTLTGLRQRLNGYYYGQDVEITLKSSADQITTLKSVNGELIEKNAGLTAKEPNTGLFLNPVLDLKNGRTIN